MGLRWSRDRASERGADVVLLLALVLLSLWLGGRVIGAVYNDNPKVHYVAPDADPLVALAWTATGLQIGAAAVWRRWPVPVWVLGAAMVVVHVVVIHRLVGLSPHPVAFAPLVPSDGVVLLSLYALTAERAVSLAAVIGALTSGLAIAGALTGPGDITVLTGVLLVATTVSVFLGGLAARERSGHLAAMTQRAADLELARVRDAELAAVAERSRLAREIHDTVAHALGIIVVQAQGGAAARQERPAETDKALAAIIGVGRQALAEMRGLLRTDSKAGLVTPPLVRSGVADVRTLAEQFHAAGRRVDVTVYGNGAALSAQVDHTIYRVVQESLTNAVKHGHPDGAVVVDINCQDDTVTVSVRSVMEVLGQQTFSGAGRGLQGMRERVELVGGTLSAGPDGKDDFVVCAVLPMCDTA